VRTLRRGICLTIIAVIVLIAAAVVRCDEVLVEAWEYAAFWSAIILAAGVAVFTVVSPVSQKAETSQKAHKTEGDHARFFARPAAMYSPTKTAGEALAKRPEVEKKVWGGEF
jgi:hypothetical protein